ncbi:MAG: trigger factor, partial [Phycisphaerae bacterium]
ALLDRADDEAEKLLEELKQKVKVEVEDAATLRKKLAITVPAEVIAQHLEHNFKELRSDAIVPGFRKGRAPLRLVQKRFAADVRESVKTSILGQSFFAAVENTKFEVLGDPLFNIATAGGEKLMEIDEALEHITLPESGDFSYACEIEIKPTFELPELKGIAVKMPKIKISKKHVDEQLLRQRKIRGRYEPLTKGKAKRDDQIIAKVRLSVDGNVIKEEDNVELGVRATRIDGILLDDLEKLFTGATPGDERSSECEIPDDYKRTDLRGQPGTFEFTIHEIKRLRPITVKALVEQSGAESEAELRQFVRDSMEDERDRLVELAKKEQVLEYLLEKIPLELPDQLSARQTERAVLRKVIDLQQRGMPQSDIDAQIDELRTSAKEEVARSLKLDFILEKVAEQLEVTVTDEEVNTEIARIARLYNQRFDRVRDNLHSRGLLAQLAEQIRQDKCIALLLADAKLEEVTPKDGGQPADADTDAEE